MRVAAAQPQLDRRHRRQPNDRGASCAPQRPMAPSCRPAREVEPARRCRHPARARRAARWTRRVSAARAWARELFGIHPSSAASPSASRDAVSSNTSLRHRPRWRHRRYLPQGAICSTSTSTASATANPTPRRPARRSSPHRLRARAGPGGLLRPPLPRALPGDGAARGHRRHRPRSLHGLHGRDHREVLLRARAIENQLFVIAAGQFRRGAAALAVPGVTR